MDFLRRLQGRDRTSSARSETNIPTLDAESANAAMADIFQSAIELIPSLVEAGKSAVTKIYGLDDHGTKINVEIEVMQSDAHGKTRVDKQADISIEEGSQLMRLKVCKPRAENQWLCSVFVNTDTSNQDINAGVSGWRRAANHGEVFPPAEAALQVPEIVNVKELLDKIKGEDAADNGETKREVVQVGRFKLSFARDKFPVHGLPGNGDITVQVRDEESGEQREFPLRNRNWGAAKREMMGKLAEMAAAGGPDRYQQLIDDRARF